MFPNSQYLFPCKVGINKDLTFDFFFYANLSHTFFYVDMKACLYLKSLFGPMFAFKGTIFCHFAGYVSVALETIWLHGPYDLIYSGPLMT